MTLPDAEYRTQLEERTLDPVHFDHIGHLRIAWLYLGQYEVKEAIARVTSVIKAYAESLGASDKFQHTLTQAIVILMASRMTDSDEESFSDFIVNNDDLVKQLPSLLAQHYSYEVINSSQARTEFVEPDIAALPELSDNA